MRSDPGDIGKAIGRIPSGCSILTCAHGGRSTGMLASWVQQAAFDPPSITVCLKKGRPASELVDASGGFVLNVIGEDPTAMFKHFGKGFAPDEDAFAGLDVEPSEFGPLIASCIAQLGCRVVEKVSVGDHDLYVAHVASAQSTDGSVPYVHIRKNGLTY